MRDLRFALRQLVKAPGFSVVAILTLGLGLGATATLFNVINTIYLKPRGFVEPARLVNVYTKSSTFAAGSVSFLDYRDLAEQASSLSSVAAYRFDILGYRRPEGVRPVWNETVTGNYFSTLGVSASLGRVFGPSDDVEGTGLGAVVSDRFFTRELGGDPAALGQPIVLNGQPFTVIGVAPASFAGMVRGITTEVWTATSSTKALYPQSTVLTERANHSFFSIARLAPGTTVERAQAEATTVTARLAELYPESNEGLSLELVRTDDVVLNPAIDGAIGGVAFILLAIPTLVLLIVCANLATLLLTRGAGRQREFAVRLALGARRAELVRQLLTESLVVGVLGGVVGVLAAAWASQAIVALRPPIPLPISLDLAIDGRVIGFTFVMAVVTGIGFGLIPAMRAADASVASDLHESRVGGGRRRSRIRAALLVGQLATSVLLLVAAGLLVRGLAGATRLDLGFVPGGAALVQFDLGHAGLDAAEGRRFLLELIDRARTLPGVVEASATYRPPLDLNVSATELTAEGHEFAAGERAPLVQHSMIAPRYFAAIGATLESGREFTVDDDADAPKVVILNREAAERLFPGGGALGRRVRRYSVQGDQAWAEVVGIAPNVKVNTPGETATPQVFFPVLQAYESSQSLVVRTSADPTTLLEPLRGMIRALDPDVGVISSGLLADRVSAGLWPARFAAWLLGALGLAGLVIASLGLYGAVAHAVAQRTRELGIRVALGASVRDVTRLVVGEGMAVVGVGLGIGLLLAALVSRLFSTFLYGVSPWDPVAFVVGPAVLAAVGLAACLIPARRATRVDPVVALRTE
ncbi:MAG: ABC transporter permease [Gemmatimonadales bacterium]